MKWMGKGGQAVLLQGQQLVSTNKELVSQFEGRSNNALLRLDREVYLVDWTEYLVDLSNSRLSGRQSLPEVSLR